MGVVLMCAGNSSRFNNSDKFMVPLNLYEKFTILDLVFSRLRKNTGSNNKLPIIVNCN